MLRVPRRPVVMALVGYLLLVGWITLNPTNPEREASILLGWAVDLLVAAGVDGSTAAAVLEAVANVVLFVPYGVLLVLLLGRRRRWVAVVVPAATSVAVETAQALWLPDRVPTVQDVVMNTLGAVVGVLCVAVWARRSSLRAPARHSSPRKTWEQSV